jgi:hypothetical protein
MFFGTDSRTDDKLCYQCKECQKISRLKRVIKIKQRQKLSHNKHPWKRTYHHIRQRCNNINATGYKNYGGRGIKCLITEQQLKELWFRDKAYSMKIPSIDRIDNDGNYKYDNCRYVEKRDNTIKENNSRRYKILQYDLNNNLIKEWSSVFEIIKYFNISRRSIYCCCSGITKTSCGFRWKYKND